MAGMRGSLKVTIRLQFIGNDNPFRDSSAGVQFFTASSLSSSAFIIQEIIGFVVDLVVEDDPESSWQDYFRTSNKSSNDNRLKILYNLSAEVRREVGKKVLECGGNAVIGYSSHFDIESGLVARAYGTACRLLKVGDSISSVLMTPSREDLLMSGVGFVVELPGLIRAPSHGQDVYAIDPEYTRLGNSTKPEGIFKLFHVRASPFMLNENYSLGSGGGIGSWSLNSTMNNNKSYHSNLLAKSLPVVSPLISFGANEKSMIAQATMRAAEWTAAANNLTDTTAMFHSEVMLLSMFSFPEYTRVRLG